MPENRLKNTSDHTGAAGKGRLNMAKLGMFMDMMIKNYVLPELAVLREWVSNGYDSHVASSVDKAVKVTLPTTLAPTLTVQDFGAGMSYDFVLESYIEMGTSSKDKANDEIGGFGIGGKSALAIASQYTLTTVHKGLKSLFIMELSPDGGLSYKAPIVELPTDDPSGVTLQVAIDRDRMSQYSDVNLNRVLGGWSSREVEITNNKQFFSIPDNAVKLDSGYVLNSIFESTKKTGLQKLTTVLGLNWRQSAVLVGPVLYVFDVEGSRTDVMSEFMVASMAIGEVSFPSSREVIEPTKINREAVIAKFSGLFSETNRLFEEKVAAISNRNDALELRYSTFSRRVDSASDVLFEGEKVPSSFERLDGDEIFNYEATGGYGKPKDYRLVKNVRTGSHPLNIQFLVENDLPNASVHSIRNNVRLFHSHEGHSPESLEGLLYITDAPTEWVRAAATISMKSSELADKCRDIRKGNRANGASNSTIVKAPRRTRRDIVGDYSTMVGSISTDENGKLRADFTHTRLIDFFDDSFDEKKTLVLSTSLNEHSFEVYHRYFPRFGVNPKDVQFIHVETRAKEETLRIVLGDKVKITSMKSWMRDNFTALSDFNYEERNRLAKMLPFSPSGSTLRFLRRVGLSEIHPKYSEIIETADKLDDFEKNFSGYSYALMFIRGLFGEEKSNPLDVADRPEFFFLTSMGYYRNSIDDSERPEIIRALNGMMERWLDNLAVEEAEEKDLAESSTKLLTAAN